MSNLSPRITRTLAWITFISGAGLSVACASRDNGEIAQTAQERVGEAESAAYNAACVVSARNACNGVGFCCATTAPNGICRDLQEDENNCGSCGHTCHSGTQCCGGTCVLLTDVNNCGSCGLACNLQHATPACVSGLCQISSCNTGWANCDGIAATGCEIDITTTSNCGSCGNSCSFLHAAASCVGGSCSMGSCNTGWGDCTGAPGCETDLTTTSNCGGCGTACNTSVGETCLAGPGGYHCGNKPCTSQADCHGTPQTVCDAGFCGVVTNCGACPGNTSCCSPEFTVCTPSGVNPCDCTGCGDLVGTGWYCCVMPNAMNHSAAPNPADLTACTLVGGTPVQCQH